MKTSGSQAEVQLFLWYIERGVSFYGVRGFLGGFVITFHPGSFCANVTKQQNNSDFGDVTYNYIWRSALNLKCAWLPINNPIGSCQKQGRCAVD